MEPSQVTAATRWQNLSTLWTLADKWFRLLEFALVLGVFYVAKEKTGKPVLAAVYWLSYGVLLMWFEELGEFAATAFGIKRRSAALRWLIWILATTASLTVYQFIAQAANAILAATSR